jgi:glycine/D-amino acid oxidase-like deaminating enzyme
MNVHVIGGGIIGMSTAYHLAKDTNVTVFERDKQYSESSFARSCGGLRHQFFTQTNVELSRYAIDFIKTQTNVGFTPNGYLMLFGNWNKQKANHDKSIAMQSATGANTQSLEPSELLKLFPQLNVDDVYRGCITTDDSEGWVDPVTLHNWFRSEAQINGVKIVFEDGITADHSDADAIVIASGCWSNAVGNAFNINIPVKGHKHTVYNVSTQAPHIPNLPLVADLITGIYLRPEGNSYIVGYDGNGDWDGVDLDPDYNSWDEVWEHLYHRFPNVFDAAKMDGAWAGYYDSSTIDNNAIIDHVDNVYFATGFTGRGLMHSPAVGLILRQMVLGETLTFNIDGYKLNRTPDVELYVI